MKRLIFCTSWLSLGLLSIATSITLMAEPIFQSFSVSSPGKVIVDAQGARINVLGEDTQAVQVTIQRGNDSEIEIREDYDIDFSQEGNEVKIFVEKKRKFGSWSSRGLVIDITVPKEFSAKLHSSGGSIAVQSLIGPVDAHTSGGSLHFEDIDGSIIGKTSGGSIKLDTTSGDVKLQTSGGSIRIGAVDGNVQARTSGGSISIERAGGTVIAKTSGGSIKIGELHGFVDAHTSGGRIVAKIPGQLSADSRLTTSGGSVTVYVMPSIKVNLSAQSSGGKFNSELPVTTQGSFSKHRAHGTINGGGPELYLKSSGGSVNLKEI